jgi:PAS domain S-box-containing protein
MVGDRPSDDVALLAVRFHAALTSTVAVSRRTVDDTTGLQQPFVDSGREARSRASVSQVIDYAIIALDRWGVIDSWNAGAQRLKGYTTRQAVGRNFAMFYTPEDRAADLPQRLLEQARTQGRVEHTGWRVRRDGSVFWADVVITAVRDEHGNLTGFVKVTRDITDQHRAEEALAAHFAAISHDLRTPIASIRMFASEIADADLDTRTAYAARIDARANHLAGMVDELFDYVMLRGRTIAISLEPIDLADLVRTAVDDLAPLLAEHVVHLVAPPVKVLADRNSMERVLANLLGNASKYSAKGSVLTISIESSHDRARLSISDQGRGIASEDLDTIFGEFKRGRLAEPDGGTGLGLASVHQLVTRQGGRTWIESQPGDGTTVTVELQRA